MASLVLANGRVRASNFLHTGILKNVLRSPGSFFDTTPQGRIINRFSKDIEVIDMLIPQSVTMFLMTSLSALGTVVVLTYTTPWVLVAIPFLGLIYFFIQVPWMDKRIGTYLLTSLLPVCRVFIVVYALSDFFMFSCLVVDTLSAGL